MNNLNQTYDIIFSGFGASSCLLIQKLHKNQELLGKKILVIDSADKRSNDKTFCFWAQPTESIVQDLHEVITHSWQEVSFDGLHTESIFPLRYYHVACERLYDLTRKILLNYDVDYVQDYIIDMYESEPVYLKTTNGEYFGEKIVDARTPSLVDATNQKQNIWQSFLGFKVSLTEGVFLKNACTLMDFSVDQHEFTQFVYVLPFSKNEGLIEFTRFGKEVIEEKYAAEQLNRYITKRYGAYTIEHVERGKIPMFMDIPTHQPTEKIISIGSRANNVKPSTGYAFKNMYDHAQRITLNNGKKNNRVPAPLRFRFYDSLLIYILSVWPRFGKSIFERLFTVKSTRFILNFLDEKTKVREDISMFYKLPIGIFLRALLFSFFDKIKPVAAVIVISACYFLLSAIVPNHANNVMYGLLFVGMLLIGIPHGALDYKLGVLSKNQNINLSFVLKYLAIMAAVYAIWLLSPMISLLLFILYSAWHFGQTDIAEWKIDSPFIGFLWGLLFFTALLSSHVTELNQILQSLEIGVLSDSPVWKLLFLGAIVSALLISLRVRNISLTILTLLLCVSYYMPVVIAFSIYFVFHHSWMGWTHLKVSLHQTNSSLFVSALPFNAGALLLFAVLFMNVGESFTFNLAMIFVFISCISFPHVFCMHFFYKNRTLK